MSATGPIFVVGAPRTGTTLVKQILNRHPRIHLFDEVHFFERIWDDRATIGSCHSPPSQRIAIERVRAVVRDFGSDQELLEHMTYEDFRRRLLEEGNGYRGLLAALLKSGAERTGAVRWGDSSPQDVLYLHKIRKWFPDVKVIGLVRDPRAFLSSSKNYHRRGVASYRERYNPLTTSLLWRSYMKALMDAEREWGSMIHRVHYEKLVTDPEGEVRKLCEHVGEEFLPELIDVEASNSSFVPSGEEETRRGIVSDSRDRWRTELTPTEVWLGERICGSRMSALGYSRSEGPLRPSLGGLMSAAAYLPSRVFNQLFRTRKPFKVSKLRRVLSNLRSG